MKLRSTFTSAVTVTALSALLLSACQPSKIPPATPTTPAGTPVPTTTTNTQPTLPQKGGMKTLQDFPNPVPGKQATITTTKGDIVVELFRDQTPLTTANFAQLASEGYYDGIVFHRVIPDFMAQVGDPLTKDESLKARWGTGGPGYTIEDEFVPELKHDGPGVLSMANTGQPATGGSQFFITYEATPWLDGKHAVFGKVTQGLDVLEKITVGDKIVSIKLQ